jgi:hypothetical protein
MSRREDYGSNDVGGAAGFEACYGDRDDDGPSRADCEREDWDATHCRECEEELDSRGVCPECGWYADAPSCQFNDGIHECERAAVYGDTLCEDHRAQMDREAKDAAAEDEADERRLEEKK